jgi:uncharacterized membrane protein
MVLPDDTAQPLLPPLTTCGILLARHLPTPAFGAFLLFLANFTAMALGAMIVSLLAGHRPAAADSQKSSRASTSLLSRVREKNSSSRLNSNN